MYCMVLLVTYSHCLFQELLSDTAAGNDNSSGDKDLGRIPRNVECELLYDLVDKCVPGDVVTANGLVGVRQDGTGEGGSGTSHQDRCLFTLFLQVNSLVNERGRSDMQIGE